MTQLGEGVAASSISINGKEECVFCQTSHQDKKKVGSHTFKRQMSQLKSQGRTHTVNSSRKDFYPSPTLAPLIGWEGVAIEAVGGYKAAAHHCIALKCVNDHKMSGEIHAAGYDPNRGSNCIWLPYSEEQFVRARAYAQKLGNGSVALQKHRGGHADTYFQQVSRGLDAARNHVAKKYCSENKKSSKQELLQILTNVETVIWTGVATAVIDAYKLYNTSFLPPRCIWGSYEKERTSTGKYRTPDDVLQIPPRRRTRCCAKREG